MTALIKIQHDNLDLVQLQQDTLHQSDAGASVNFIGFVRQHDYAEPLSHLWIEHYPEVTEYELLRIVQHALTRWQVHQIHVVHRVGTIAVGEPIVWVHVSAKHRAQAYAANEFVMDYLKIAAPFWKKEIFANGQERWVAAKLSDQDKYKKWVE